MTHPVGYAVIISRGNARGQGGLVRLYAASSLICNDAGGPPTGPGEGRDGAQTQEAVPSAGDPAGHVDGARGGAGGAGEDPRHRVRPRALRREGGRPPGYPLPRPARRRGALGRRRGAVGSIRGPGDRRTVRVPPVGPGGRAERSPETE